jgi:hypothetical protein
MKVRALIGLLGRLPRLADKDVAFIGERDDDLFDIRSIGETSGDVVFQLQRICEHCGDEVSDRDSIKFFVRGYGGGVTPIMQLGPGGEISVRGSVVGNDSEVVDILREIVRDFQSRQHRGFVADA